MKVDYGLFGRRVNAPEALARVRDRVTPPAECPKCRSTVDLVNHAEIYGKEYGWPLLYLCCGCGARVGTHPGTDIPLGTLADERTIKARRETHELLDGLWRSNPDRLRSRVYAALNQLMGSQIHIGWLDFEGCQRVMTYCRTGQISRLISQSA